MRLLCSLRFARLLPFTSRCSSAARVLSLYSPPVGPLCAHSLSPFGSLWDRRGKFHRASAYESRAATIGDSATQQSRTAAQHANKTALTLATTSQRGRWDHCDPRRPGKRDFASNGSRRIACPVA